MHKLDLGTGAELSNSPHVIARDLSPVGFAALENQRVGLSLVLNRVVVGWAGPGGRENAVIGVNGQSAPYYGYVMSFDADTLAQTGCFTTGSNGNVMAGIWQSGRAPVADTDGFVYYFTGNGAASLAQGVNQCSTPFAPARSLSNSLVKLDVRDGLPLVVAAADPDTDLLDYCDLDLGGSGPMHVPGTPFLLGGGKQGLLHVISPDATGALRFDAGTQVYPGPREDFDVPDPALKRNALCQKQGDHHIMGGPVYWSSASFGSIVYLSAEDNRDPPMPASFIVRSFAFDTRTGILGTPLSGNTTYKPVHPAAILSLSADGTRAGSGILWAVHSDRTMAMPGGNRYTEYVPGILRAFDAEDLSHELWNSDDTPSDGFGNFAKFAAVTVANGHVYVPTFSGQVVVYGLLSAPH